MISGTNGGAENGQGGFGGPPWQNESRYLRNSPISYVDHIETPLLLIHGDRDQPVPIQQSEELFSALYRQNKRAEFVRYWGEGHGIEGTDNVRDMWSRILAWLDQFTDIARDQQGNVLWDRDHVKSSRGRTPIEA